MSGLVIYCDNGSSHTHRSFSELQSCVGTGGAELRVRVTRPTAPPKAAPTSPVAPVPGTPGGYVGRHGSWPVTVPQLSYIERLGGSWRDAKQNATREEASLLIDMLKDDSMRHAFVLPVDVVDLDSPEWDAFPVERDYRLDPLKYGPLWVTPTGNPPHAEKEASAEPVELKTGESVLKTMMPLIDSIDNGYYAVEMGDGSPLKFLRFSRPKGGVYKSCLKVQTQHADRLELAWVRWPSGRISREEGKIEDYILLVMGDKDGAARRYAKELGRCCRCNTELTDERSRHFGIGPECEKHWPHIVAMVELEDQAAREEEERNGKSF